MALYQTECNKRDMTVGWLNSIGTWTAGINRRIGIVAYCGSKFSSLLFRN
jgi:hypothetical protein